MILYLIIITIAMVLVALGNIIWGTAFFGYSPGFVMFAVATTTIFQFVIDGIFAIIVNKLPDKWFDVNKKCFDVSKGWQRFYEKLQIRKWKSKVWELGALAGFRKDKLYQPKEPKYIERFIIESNKGIVTHRIGYVAGFLGVFLFPLKYALVIGVPIAIVNLILNILPTMILRYNIPKLKALYIRVKRTETEQKSII